MVHLTFLSPGLLTWKPSVSWVVGVRCHSTRWLSGPYRSLSSSITKDLKKEENLRLVLVLLPPPPPPPPPAAPPPPPVPPESPPPPPLLSSSTTLEKTNESNVKSAISHSQKKCANLAFLLSFAKFW